MRVLSQSHIKAMIFDKPISLAVSAVTSLMFEFTKIPHIERFNQPTFTYRA